MFLLTHGDSPCQTRPARHYPRSTPNQHCRRSWPLRRRGTVVTPNASPAPTPLIRCGGTATSSSSDSDQIVEFLKAKWERELDYVLRKDLWAFQGHRIAVRFQYEWHDTSGQWFRSYGNENWEFDANGYMSRREASINDVRINESDRRIHGPRAEGDTSGIPLQ